MHNVNADGKYIWDRTTGDKVVWDRDLDHDDGGEYTHHQCSLTLGHDRLEEANAEYGEREQRYGPGGDRKHNHCYICKAPFDPELRGPGIEPPAPEFTPF